MKQVPLVVSLIALAAFVGCPEARAQSPETAAVVHRVFLIGDTGGFEPDVDEPVLAGLRAQLMDAGAGGTVVFLGDNIYGRGLPAEDAPGRLLAERRLVQQLEAVKGTGARVVVVPGNHDWDNSGPDGPAAVRRQEVFVEAFLDQGNTFLPDDGLPGPETVKLAEDVRLVVIDTEWWLRTQDKPFGDAGRYETREEGDVIANLADVLRRHDDSRLLVVGHHPLVSNGPHGGRLPLKTHLFPLTELWDTAFVPLPVVGSLYALIRAWSGGPQDLSHARYRALVQTLVPMLEEFENHIVYASGHDHSLQYFPGTPVDYLISGSASRPEYVGQGRGAAFASSEPGFLEVVYREDDSAEIIAHGANAELFRAEMHPPRASGTDLPRATPEEIPAGRDTVFVGAAAPELAAGPLKAFFFGKAHRDAWTTPVSVPVLDVDRLFGGLRPIQRGGGQQTVSVRLENPDGHQYVLRSLAKDPTKTLPFELRETVARDVVLDQVSILHPYGALLVPPLAEAVGIYHATPNIYFVPDDPRLAPYESIVGGRVMMLEERPDDDMSHAAQFGHSEDVVGATKMYSELLEDNDNTVDARFFARNRVFDMLISDWDRHEDQWRWAEFEPADGRGTLFRPIPRDRDWAFNRMDGLGPNIVQSKLILPKFQEFKEDFGFVLGLNNNGIRQDRRLAASLTPDDWVEIADSVASVITDPVIRSALARWPAAVQERQSAEFERIFRSRREGLARAVGDYTDYLDQYVDVVMSDKHEEFEILPAAPGHTRVRVHKTTKEGDRTEVLFDRVFDQARTKEVRLYGMGGTDRFHIEETGSTIRFHVVGGTGPDQFTGSSRTPRTVHLYDTADGMDIHRPGRARVRVSTNPTINHYDPGEFRFNVTLASLFVGSNEDDGVYLGGGPVFYRHAFRKKPFAAKHRIRANSTARFQAFNVVYDGQLTEALGAWDLVAGASIRSPNSFRNFFGLGNETANDRRNREFYQARLSEYRASLGLRRRAGARSHVSILPFVSSFDVAADPDRFISQAGVSPSSLEDQFHVGLTTALEFDTRDSPVIPTRGLRWRTAAEYHGGLNPVSRTYGRVSSRLALYQSRTIDSRLTLALRGGVEHLFGPFPFWAAATLGGSDNLRGWRSTRFAGRTAVFNNLELRLRLSKFVSYLAQGRFGLLGFIDHGRVWTDNQESGLWHRGGGVGVWTGLFDALAIRATVGFSEEQRTFVLATGFQF